MTKSETSPSSRRWKRERSWRMWGRQRNKVEYKYSLGLLCEILRLLLSEALLFHGEALWQVLGEALWLLHSEALRQFLGEALRLLYSEALRLQNGTTALLLTGDVTVQLLCCGCCINTSLHSFKICIILTKKNICILNNNYYL